MSVKSTVYLTRAEAEKRWVEHMLAKRRAELKILASPVFASDTHLEDELEIFNDNASSGPWGGMENYLIRYEPT